MAWDLDSGCQMMFATYLIHTENPESIVFLYLEQAHSMKEYFVKQRDINHNWQK